MHENDIHREFGVQKILDYVQYVYDNYDVLNDGQIHYIDEKVFVCRLGEHLKIGKTKTGGKAFAFVKNPALNYSGINRCDIYPRSKNTFHFENGVLYERVMEYSNENGRRINIYDKEVELNKEFVFHALLREENEYILTYEESVRVQEMNKSFGFELHFTTMPKKRVRNERNC